MAPSDLLGRVRRDVDRSLLRARNGLKHLSGVGRPDVGVSPKDTVWSKDKVELWRYRSDERRVRPPVLLVMSLVSKSYVLDLRPGASFVEFLLGEGFDVYLGDWGIPDELEAGNTLETYCDELLPEMIDAVRAESDSDTVTIFGYCFGGLLSLLYAAGHPDGPVENLVVMATPVDFTHMGPMQKLMQQGRLEPETLLDESGNVPPEAVFDSMRVLKPTGEVSSYANLWQNMWNDEFLESYQALTGWSTDHIPFPGQCFLQTVELFNRGNRLAQGTVPLGGRVIDLHDITWPFLNVIAEKDHIVPPEATGPLTTLVGSADVEELRLPAGHVGLVVGRSAQKRTMPAMADWMHRHSSHD